jgi:type IV fimbrial biogenesis protein FimT
MSGMTSKKRASGFTMMELLMVIAISGILAAIGIPSFQYVTASNRIATELNTLVGDLQFARSEAVKSGLPVTVCASTDGASCANSDTWDTGWIVFADLNGDKTFDNASDSLLRVQKGFATTGSSDTLVASSTAFQAVVFNREGYAATGVASVVNLALHSAPVNNQWTRCLAVTPIGALIVEKYGDQKYGSTTPSCS